MSFEYKKNRLEKELRQKALDYFSLVEYEVGHIGIDVNKPLKKANICLQRVEKTKEGNTITEKRITEIL